MVGVDDQRLGGFELMLKGPRQSLVPALTLTGQIFNGRVGERVVVDVEVWSIQDLEFKVVVLDLVPSEILRFGRRGNRHGRRNSEPQQELESGREPGASRVAEHRHVFTSPDGSVPGLPARCRIYFYQIGY